MAANKFLTKPPAVALLALGLGVINAWFLAQVMTWFVNHAYPMGGLYALGFRGMPLTVGNMLAEAFILMMFTLPSAFIVIFIWPGRLILATILVALPMIVLSLGPIAMNPSHFINSWVYFTGFGIAQLVPVPLAVYLLYRLCGKVKPVKH